MAAVQDCLDEVARSTRAVVIVVGTTDNPDRLPAATLAMFKHDIILVVSDILLVHVIEVLMSFPGTHRAGAAACTGLQDVKLKGVCRRLSSRHCYSICGSHSK
jgi:hypothetical protein